MFRGWVLQLLALLAALQATDGLLVHAVARTAQLKPTQLPTPRTPARVAADGACRMQVIEAPVKIPDSPAQLAPTKPSGQRSNQKGKKHKLLLFNDNVNRCAHTALFFLHLPPHTLCGQAAGLSRRL
jgi:hypothetical protein